MNHSDDIIKILEEALNTPISDEELAAYDADELDTVERDLLEARLTRQMEAEGFWSELAAAPPPEPEPLETYLALADDASPMRRLRSVRGLRHRDEQDSRILQTLERLSGDADEDVRERATAAIAAIDHRQRRDERLKQTAGAAPVRAFPVRLHIPSKENLAFDASANSLGVAAAAASAKARGPRSVLWQVESLEEGTRAQFVRYRGPDEDWLDLWSDKPELRNVEAKVEVAGHAVVVRFRYDAEFEPNWSKASILVEDDDLRAILESADGTDLDILITPPETEE